MKTYTEQQVIDMLVSVLMYCPVTLKIYGDTYGEQAQTVIDVNDHFRDSSKSVLSVMAGFKGGLHSPKPDNTPVVINIR